MPGIDYSARYRDYARFTPAISEMYTRYVVNDNPKREPPVTRPELDFLNPETGLFYLPCSLYSAGQAAKSAGMSHKKDMVTGRDKSHTTILGDSGGFQIQTGAIPFKGDETRNRMMKWMEENCDWSMILDFPTGGIDMGTITPHTERLKSGPFVTNPDGSLALDKNGNKIPNPLADWGNGDRLAELCNSNGFSEAYNTCLLQTLINNDWFVANRTPGATKFLNVVQGRNNSESEYWYQQVKHYPFEGWSLAANHKENFEMTLSRIIQMRDDGLLNDRDWMHFLGVGKFQHGCVYTTIQRCIRESVNDKFTISYDVSSPFTLAAYGKVFVGYNVDKNSWSIQGEKLDGRHFLPTNTYTDDDGVEQIGHEMISTGKGRTEYLLDKNGNRIPLPPKGAEADRPFLDVLREMYQDRLGKESGGRFVETEVGKRLTMGDICVNVDPKFTSTWDVVSYALLMNHNIQVHLEGVFETQDLYDKSDRSRPETYDPSAFKKVPTELLQIREVIYEVFKSETPMQVIEENRKILNLIAGEKAERGVLVDEGFEKAPERDHNASVKAAKIHAASMLAENKPEPELVSGFEETDEEALDRMKAAQAHADSMLATNKPVPRLVDGLFE